MTDNEVVMYLVFRADLNMPKGKIAAQAGHAVQLAMLEIDNRAEPAGRDRAFLREWEDGSYTKIALKVADEAELNALCAALDKGDLLYARVVDEGRTVVEAGTTTALGIQPLPRSQVKPYVQKLKLL